MRASFEQKLIAASGFLVLCSVGACIFGAANGANAAARTAQTEISAVNRINKGDQLTPALIHQVQQRLIPPAAAMKTSLQRPPLGCDGAFSPVADPARAGVYKRCTV
jgi:hypothetical protein